MTKLLSMFPMMLCVVLVNSLFLAKDSDAANVISYMQSGCTHKIEGEIREEDVLRVKNIVGKDYIIFDEGGAFDVARPVFCLDSGGGSFIAGLQISYFFMEQGISTKIEKLDSCLSSCGIIFLGGSIRLEDTHRPNRTMVSGATLGLHAPYLSRENDLNYTEIQASEIFDLATFAMTATLSVFTYKSVFHDKMWVDPSLIAETNLFGRDEF